MLKKIMLIFIGVLVFSKVVEAEIYECKTKEFLKNVSLKYSLNTSGVEGINNFLDIYESRKKIYNKFLSFINNLENKKTFLSCSDEIDCNYKASMLAREATLTITWKEKFKNSGFIFKQAALKTGDMLWTQTKLGYSIATSGISLIGKSGIGISLLISESDISIIEDINYLINLTDALINASITIDSINDDSSIELLELIRILIPSIKKLINEPLTAENISKISKELSKVAKILKQNQVANYSELLSNITSFISKIKLVKLYYEAVEEYYKNLSCVDFSMFTGREKVFLNKLPEYIAEEILYDSAKVIQSIFEIIKIDEASKIVNLISSTLEGISWNMSEKRTFIGNILTVSGLINKKETYNDAQLLEFLESINKLNIMNFINAIIIKDHEKISDYLDYYNKGLEYVFKEELNETELLNPTINHIIGIAIYKKANYYCIEENTDPVDLIWEDKKTYEAGSTFLKIKINSTSKSKNKSYILDIWGKDGNSQKLLIDSNGKVINGNFVFKKDKAFRVGNTNIYYYKYSIFNGDDPVYVYSKYKSPRGDKFTYDRETGRFYIDNNFGVVTFKYDGENEKVHRLIDKHFKSLNSIYPLHYKYNTFPALVDRISIGEFLKIGSVLQTKLNISSKYIMQLNKKLYKLREESDFVPLWYGYVYFYVMQRIINKEEISEKTFKNLIDNNEKYIKILKKRIHTLPLRQSSGTFLRRYHTFRAFNRLIERITK